MKKLFLFDLDLTLIDQNYHPTLPFKKFITVVNLLSKQGNIFGLISNSAFKSLADWAKRFNFQGPIVSEKGALVSDLSNHHSLTYNPKVDWFKTKRWVIATLQKKLPQIAIKETFYSELIKNTLNNNDEGLINNQFVVINPYRRFSFSLLTCEKTAGGIKKNVGKFYSEIVKIINSELDLLNIKQLLTVDINPLYAAIILNEKNVEKFTAIPKLRKLYPEYQFIMIGDGLSDALLKGHVDILWAVGNACPELKKAADFIATGEITTSSLEILEQYK